MRIVETCKYSICSQNRRALPAESKCVCASGNCADAHTGENGPVVQGGHLCGFHYLSGEHANADAGGGANTSVWGATVQTETFSNGAYYALVEDDGRCGVVEEICGHGLRMSWRLLDLE